MPSSLSVSPVILFRTSHPFGLTEIIADPFTQPTLSSILPYSGQMTRFHRRFPWTEDLQFNAGLFVLVHTSQDFHILRTLTASLLYLLRVVFDCAFTVYTPLLASVDTILWGILQCGTPLLYLLRVAI